MNHFFQSLANVVLDRSADELIGAVLIALCLSLAFAGIDFLARRKNRDGRTLLIGLMIGANLSSMAIAAGYLTHIRRSRATLPVERPQAQTRPYVALVDSIFRTADENRDGFLSSEEAATGAAEFVRRADPTGKGLIDPPSLEQAMPSSGSYRGRRPGGAPFGGPQRVEKGPRRGPRAADTSSVEPADLAPYHDSTSSPAPPSAGAGPSKE
jgi:hypothetical protein